MNGKQGEEGTFHSVDERLLAIRAEDLDDALQVDGVSPDEDALAAILEDEIKAERVRQIVAVVRAEDPEATIGALFERGVVASPIHVLGYQGHRGYLTGTQPRGSTQQLPDTVPDGSERKIIAVVDSGIVPEHLPSWMQPPNLRFDEPDDVETVDEKTNPASHGTFVASLIRMSAPEHVVSLASAGPYPGSTVHPAEPRHADEPFPTTELHVADAILRLIERHRCEDVVALNLSVGGPSFNPRTDRAMVTVSVALDVWRARFGDCVPIFASAGNTTDQRPVYPAAFDFVRAVAAAENGGGQIVWDQGANPINAGFRDWVTDIAPGSLLVGVGGAAKPSTINWSGSSFACAVATASYARQGSRDVRNGLVWWSNRPVDYARIPGLLFD